jgi:hypothetical protein
MLDVPGIQPGDEGMTRTERIMGAMARYEANQKKKEKWTRKPKSDKARKGMKPGKR